MGAWRDLTRRVRTDAARPVVTFLDLATGERMELSAATLLNAAAKTAGMLRDELDVEPGATIAVDLPLHWQCAVVAGALDATGSVADLDSATGAKLGFVDRARLHEFESPIVVSLQPFGLPDPEGLPDQAVDHALLARIQPDVFLDDATAGEGNAPNVETPSGRLTRGDVDREARRIAEELGLGPGDRLLVTDAGRLDPLRRWLLCLAVPLVADASVVLVRHADGGDVNAVAHAERITVSDSSADASGAPD